MQKLILIFLSLMIGASVYARNEKSAGFCPYKIKKQTVQDAHQDSNAEQESPEQQEEVAEKKINKQENPDAMQKNTVSREMAVGAWDFFKIIGPLAVGTTGSIILVSNIKDPYEYMQLPIVLMSVVVTQIGATYIPFKLKKMKSFSYRVGSGIGAGLLVAGVLACLSWQKVL